MLPERLARRSTRVRLVIFDCDGVLVDSEPVSSRIIAADLSARGWPMSDAEANRRFLGMTLGDMRPLVEARVGALAPTWQGALQARIVRALAQEAVAVEGAVEALQAVAAMGLAWRIASNSSRAEMAVKFDRLGIGALVAGRVHSKDDVAHGKPAPDLFLAAAAAEGIAPAACLVVEDSVPGVRAAMAAGMDCLGYAPHDDGAELLAAGAAPFHAMRLLPGLIAAARVAA
ncbi:MAG: HAD-IA family hydrolase [Alphaproteobacteria bacterium]|nr:HAD-IA family hydrolase [Alphaproteobacteria bacterium]